MFRYNEAEGAFENIKNGKRLDVQGGRDQEGNNVQVYRKNGTPAQKWKLVYETDAEKLKTEGTNSEYGFDIARDFYIVSRMPMNRVVTTQNGNNMQIRTLSDDRNDNKQKWFFDNVSKTIKSRQWPDKSITVSGGWLYMRPTNSRWFQLFKYKNGNIRNIKDKRVMDVSNYQDTEGRAVGIYRRHNKSNQQFDIVYVDEMPAMLKKGEKNEKFGFYIERPFYIISQLPGGRFLDVRGNNLVINSRSESKMQQWQYNERTRTVQNIGRPNWSLDIRSAGRSKNMQIWHTNSGWW